MRDKEINPLELMARPRNFTEFDKLPESCTGTFAEVSNSKLFREFIGRAESRFEHGSRIQIEACSNSKNREGIVKRWSLSIFADGLEANTQDGVAMWSRDCMLCFYPEHDEKCIIAHDIKEGLYYLHHADGTFIFHL